MKVIGLTGSIGMGKSTTATMLRRLGLPVFDADATVHGLMARGGTAVSAVEAVFPGVVKDGVVDRKALGARVFADPAALRRLEAILHPLTGQAQRRFVAQHRRARRRAVVLDIPLLFEAGGYRRCDLVMVVSAPAFLQKQRVLARPAMTEAKLRGILAQQMSDAAKRRRAHVVIPTGLGFGVTMRALKRFLHRQRIKRLA